jgi:hypothetical protein
VEESIEEQVANLEREVSVMQTEADMEMDVDMDEEEEEEDGEIQDEVPVALPPSSSEPSRAPTPPPAASLPLSAPTRRKRPNAEEFMDARPLPARLPPAKRRLFGGLPQRPQRLMMSLDDSDSEDEEERPRRSLEATPVPVIQIPEEHDRRSLLAAKDESIRKLKEEIERRKRAKMRKAAEAGGLDGRVLEAKGRDTQPGECGCLLWDQGLIAVRDVTTETANASGEQQVDLADA